MSTINLQFKNSNGQDLSAKLELPESRKPHSFAIFAHCFTCNKNLTAVRNIARSLNVSGIAVLRFDFTGLGSSEGDFSDTNFSSNVDDLISAASFLEMEYKAPDLLIGHSLGGAAVLFAGGSLPSVKAIATIGAPAHPEHVAHLLKGGIEELKKSGEAEISIGGRPFLIKKQFLDDISSQKMEDIVPKLKKAIAVFHSPQDTIVGIKNAKDIYQAAIHPKSFISLDRADHLLSNKRDSLYVGKVIAGWAERYLDIPERTPLKTEHQTVLSLGNEGFTAEVQTGKHFMIVDEPEHVGGNDFGPSPYELMASSLAACTAMTLRMYATHKKWDLQKVVVHINHGKEHCDDCEFEGKKINKVDHFDREIELFGDLTQDQKERIIKIANKCPVHKTLSTTSKISTRLKE